MKQKNKLPPLYPLNYAPIIKRALNEDFGEAGDVTTDAIVAVDSKAVARIVSRSEGCLAGLEVALSVFTALDNDISIDRKYIDGQDIPAGETIALISGSARVLLSGERTALNLLGRMSGISTMTRNLSLTVKNYKARIVCTRKTAPGLRLLDKYSVRAGGGVNHRFGLGDGILIKDNHRLIAGGISNAVESVRKRLGHMVKLEVEVDTLAQLQEVLDLGVDAVLLDNMTPSILADAVSIVDGRVLTEASGGITPEKVTEVAATGVDLISLGWLTHSVKNWDVGLDFEP
ncbi:MAG: nicotinate-nucleotide diphosphorylase (carboxylating) [Rhodospirillaceae bacterium]|nr:nicotinate-nucleotide diphosphorylase (carboxylating) [Rhodospirillaceae bacterium]|tara:strand:- start:4047 stop:4910 length:864 start_codon:yes stop_codon:yes gene_type:complete